jgi:hypothetical protein
MGAKERLEELGLSLPEVAVPLASYIPAQKSGNYVYTSGQLPLVDGELIATGKGNRVRSYMRLERPRSCCRDHRGYRSNRAGRQGCWLRG